MPSSAFSACGEQKFMEDLYRRYSKLMFATAWRYLSDPSEVEDVIQTCLIKLFRKEALLRTLEEAPLAAYIQATVRNTIFSQAKREKIGEKTVARLKQRKENEEAPSLDEWMIREEQAEALSRALQNMKPQDRILLEGKYFLSYTDEELAALLKCKPDSIRMKLTRARRTALRMLEEVE